MKIIICDHCKKEVKNELEIQEMINIKHNCGYNTIFIDGNIIEIDLCQECFKKLVLDKIWRD